MLAAKGTASDVKTWTGTLHEYSETLPQFIWLANQNPNEQDAREPSANIFMSSLLFRK